MDSKIAELILELIKNQEGRNTTHKDKVEGSKIKIVVYQRGWVAIGRYSEEGDKCILENACVIRRWGTDMGLGQLALEGKRPETKLEPTNTIRAMKLTTVNIIDCDDKKWKELL